jgi:hypothetical protein
MRLSQSNVILFCLCVAFVVFITLRGELPAYLNVLFTTQGQSGSSSQPGGADQGATASQTASDPIGAAAGALRRSLGIGNGILPNLGSILGF